MSLGRRVNWTKGLVVGPRHLEELEEYGARLARASMSLARPGPGLLPGTELEWSASGTAKSIVVSVRRLTALCADGALVTVGPGNEVTATFDGARLAPGRLQLAAAVVPGEHVALADPSFDERGARLVLGEAPFRLPKIEVRPRVPGSALPGEFVFGEVSVSPSGPRVSDAFVPHAHAFAGHASLAAAEHRIAEELDALTAAAWDVALTSDARGQAVASVVAACLVPVRDALPLGPAAFAARLEAAISVVARAPLGDLVAGAPARRSDLADAGLDVAWSHEASSWLRRVLEEVRRAPVAAPPPRVEAWDYRTATDLETRRTFDVEGGRVSVTGEPAMLRDVGGAWEAPFRVDANYKRFILSLDRASIGGLARMLFEAEDGTELAEAQVSLAPEVPGHRNFHGTVTLDPGEAPQVAAVRVLGLPPGVGARAAFGLWAGIRPGRR